MGTIYIDRSSYWNFHFKEDDEIKHYQSHHICGYCSATVDPTYCYIIDCLKEAGLIPQDYKYMCCYCRVLKEIGILEWRCNLNRFIYNPLDDVLTMLFSKRNEDSVLYFKIHEFSKLFE